MHTTEQLNTALAGRYAVERRLGEGGMATVYLARDVRHNRRVALKVLKPDLGAVVGVERFLSEIQVTANLQHPNLLPLFDSGEAQGLLFYVMPYVDGETLRARLVREKQLPIEDAVQLATSVASALDYAHRHGVIHRDLKPENILLHEGQPLVADFGIALAVSNAGGNRITQTGLSLGTPQYMSPEQATGDRAIDARTDVYSLGAVAYEMLTGEPPHTGSTSQAIIARVVTEKPRSIRSSRPSVPPHVEGAVEHALEKLPADRWATAKEFSEALTGARPVTLSPALAAPMGVPTAVVSAKSEGWRVRVLAMAPWAIALGGVAAAVWPRLQRVPSPVPARFTIELPESVTVSAGGGTKLALSRDGSQLVVAAGKPGEPSALYLRRLDDPLMERVRGTDTATSPTFSPDGRWLMYNVGPNLKTVPVAGGTPRVIATAAGTASWGDGGRVVFTNARALWLTTSDGGERRLLASPDSLPGMYDFAYPEVLPGGEDALVTIGRGSSSLDSARLGVVSLKDGAVTELGVAGTNPRYVSSGHVVFGRPGGEVYAVPFSLRSRRVTGPPALLLQNLWQTGRATGLAVAQNGTLAYYASTFTATLAMFAVDHQGVEQQLTRQPAYYKEPRVSPDGRRIAVRIDPSVTTGDLWIFEIATGTLTRLTSDSGSLRGEWTRDGSRVVYIQRFADSARVMSRSWDRSGADAVLAVARSFGGPLGLNEVSLGPAKGLSALRIGTDVSNPNLWLAPTDSLGAMRPFIATPYVEREPRVSPSGRVLAYVSHESGRAEVYLTPIPGPGPRVPVSVDGGTEPMWSPDGATLYYRGLRRMMAAAVVERPTLSVSRRDSLFVDRYARYAWHQAYDVFPDGRRFLMTRTLQEEARATSALYVIVNWQQMLGRQRGIGSER